MATDRGTNGAGGALDGAALGSHAGAVATRLTQWSEERASERIWRKDPSFWPQAAPSDVETRLGWLTLPQSMATTLGELRQFAEEVGSNGFEHVLLLGMGGSSLAPEVYARTFGPAPGYPDFRVLDSTHPETVQDLVHPDAVARTLFIVSSKSGTTLEPNAFFHYAWAKALRSNASPGRQFVAITDPGTPLQKLAEQRKFRRCFLATPDVGGRYSALTAFGLVPCAMIGHDPAALLESAQRMSRACGPAIEARGNPGLALGAILGELTLVGRDKVVFLTSASVSAFPSWVEQLIAESLGKQGRGIVPVPDEDRPAESLGARDAVLVHLRLRSEPNPMIERALDAASSAGTPVLRFDIADPNDLGQEIFRWELAIASAGAVIGVNPFDQPDVEFAKELAREAMKFAASGSPSGPATPSALSAASATSLAAPLRAWLGSARPGDYIAVQAFLARSEANRAAVEELGAKLRARSRLATTTGFGPRFLHSTGQMHKGGPPTGLFLQLIDDPTSDVEVPEMSIGFGRILRAQADGDARALVQKQRRLLRINVGSNAVDGLRSVGAAVGA